MITLALDTATARCTVAATDGDLLLEAHLDGARRHTRDALGVVDDLVRQLGAGPGDIGLVLSGDGPGSFTGLRVATSIAKAILWGRPTVKWRVAPSLLVQGYPHLPGGSGRVLALSDALRGEVYAGCWDVRPDGVTAVSCRPEAILPARLSDFRDLTAVVALLPASLLAEVEAATGIVPISGEMALPDARMLITLSRIEGGTELIADPERWRPAYGRPVEAQAVWERKNGRQLPDQTYRSG